MLMIVPGAGILTIPYLFWSCSVRKWHLVGGNWLHCSGSLQCLSEFLAEMCFLFYLTLALMWELLIVHATVSRMSSEGISFRRVAEILQIQASSTTSEVGLVFLLRILSIHIVGVSAQVQWHKCQALKTLNMSSGNSAAIVKSFAEKFGGSWRLGCRHIPSSVWNVRHQGAPSCFERVLFPFSAPVLIAGRALRQIRFGRAEQDDSFFAVLLLTTILVAILQSLCWATVLFRICSSAMGVKRNQVQLLLFSCISLDSIQYLSATERELLDEMGQLEEDFRQKYLRIKGDLGKAQRCSHRAASPTHTNWEFDSLVLENMRQVEDVETWWAVRRFVQIDCKDESAIMDACGSVVLFLLQGFLVSGIADLSLHNDPSSPFFLTSLVLSLVVIFVMLRVFEVCIGINNILDRDTFFLTEAMLKAVHIPDPVERTRVISALQAIERRLSVYDDKQRLVGIEATANLRNGWIASLFVTLFSYGSRFVTPVLSQLDMDFLEQLLRNQSGLGGES